MNNWVLATGAVGVVLAAVALLPATMASASGSATADLSVQATILSSCAVTTTPVGFGAYDPGQAGDNQAQGAVTLICTAGTIPTVSLANGQFFAQAGKTSQGATTPAKTTSGVTITRAMGNSGSFLGYDLFADTSYATIWNSTNTISPGAIGSNQPVILTVYGDIPAKQTQALNGGTYSDSVMVTVTWP